MNLWGWSPGVSVVANRAGNRLLIWAQYRVECFLLWGRRLRSFVQKAVSLEISRLHFDRADRLMSFDLTKAIGDDQDPAFAVRTRLCQVSHYRWCTCRSVYQGHKFVRSPAQYTVAEKFQRLCYSWVIELSVDYAIYT